MGNKKYRKLKPVYYNLEKELELYEHAQNCKPSFAEWVKEKQRDEIIKQTTGIDSEIKLLVERLVETKMAGFKIQPAIENGNKLTIDFAQELTSFLI